MSDDQPTAADTATPTDAGPTDASFGDAGRPGLLTRFRRFLGTEPPPRPTYGPDSRAIEVIDPPPGGERTPILPWNRNGQAIQSLTRGFDELTGLMGDIRDGLRDQRDRQDALLDQLRHLPETLAQVPEANRQTAEALRNVGRQLEAQRESQDRLGDALSTIEKGGAATRESIDDVQKRLERMREADAQVAETLGGVGKAIGDVGRTSSQSTAALERMQAAMQKRDEQFEAALAKQSSRMSGLLAVAVVISLLSLAVAGVLAYLLWTGRVAGV